MLETPKPLDFGTAGRGEAYPVLLNDPNAICDPAALPVHIYTCWLYACACALPLLCLCPTARCCCGVGHSLLCRWCMLLAGGHQHQWTSESAETKGLGHIFSLAACSGVLPVFLHCHNCPHCHTTGTLSLWAGVPAELLPPTQPVLVVLFKLFGLFVWRQESV